MRALAAFLALTLLCACAAAPRAPGAGINMGAEVEAPEGFTELCRREPSAPECGGGR